jgi:hypothetical protein
MFLFLAELVLMFSILKWYISVMKVFISYRSFIERLW